MPDPGASVAEGKVKSTGFVEALRRRRIPYLGSRASVFGCVVFALGVDLLVEVVGIRAGDDHLSGLIED